MMQIHVQEKQQFKKLFKQEHIDSFEDRFKVLEAFLQTEKHVSLNELVERLDHIGWRLDYHCVPESLKKRVTGAAILNDVMGSDHCPVSVEIDLGD